MISSRNIKYDLLQDPRPNVAVRSPVNKDGTGDHQAEVHL